MPLWGCALPPPNKALVRHGMRCRGRSYESIGIEHATPKSIQRALKCTKTYDKDAEPQFKFETLYEMGLVQTPSEQVRHDARV